METRVSIGMKVTPSSKFHPLFGEVGIIIDIHYNTITVQMLSGLVFRRRPLEEWVESWQEKSY